MTPSSLDTSLRAAVEARAWGDVIALIETHWALLTQTNHALLVDAVNALPPEVLAQNPRFSAARTYANFLPVNGDTRPVRFRYAPTPGPGALLDVLADLTSRSVSARFEGNHRQAVAHVRDALAILEDASDEAMFSIRQVIPDIRVQWAITLELAGELVDANRMYERTFDEALAVGNRRMAVKSAGSVALNYALAGNRSVAEQWLKRVPDTSDSESAEHAAIDTVRTTSGLARALLAANDLRFAEAAAALRAAPPADVDRETWALRLHVEAALARASGRGRAELGKVRTVLETQPELHRTTGLNGWLSTTTVAELHMALGDIAAADETIAQLGAYEPLTAADPAGVLRSWVALRRGNPRKALLLAASGLAHPFSSQRVRVELQLVLAAASLMLGVQEDAQNHVAALMETLVDEKLAIVLLRLTAAEREALLADHAAALGPRLLKELDRLDDVVTAPLAASLTERERVVLRYIVQGLGPSEIATKEHLSRNTIKTQIRSIYRKLGVADREGILKAAIASPHLLA